MKIGFIGLGTMGFPMAGHLATAGFQVTVYNRTAETAFAWSKRYPGLTASTPSEASTGADIAFTCVGDDPDVEEVVLGPTGILNSIGPGGIIVDHTTTSANLARKIYNAAKERNVEFLDAPVSGGEVGAINGVLSIMCGGSIGAFTRISPVLDTYSSKCRLVGPVGHGQLTKMVNQICIAGIIQSLSEALNFGQTAGLEMDAALDVVSKGAAQSWQLDNRAQSMLERKFDFGFAVDWMRKDLRICLEQAKGMGISLPITEIVDELFSEVQAKGVGHYDTSSLMILNDRDVIS